MPFRDVAEASLGPKARVYEHGWQSWSPTGTYPATATSSRPSDGRVNAVHYRGRDLPGEGFQAEGLLALDPGDGGAVRVWSAPDPTREGPSIRACARQGRLVVSADGAVNESTHDSGLWTALAIWADGVAQQVGVAPLHSPPPLWRSCTTSSQRFARRTSSKTSRPPTRSVSTSGWCRSMTAGRRRSEIGSNGRPGFHGQWPRSPSASGPQGEGRESGPRHCWSATEAGWRVSIRTGWCGAPMQGVTGMNRFSPSTSPTPTHP